MTAPADSARHRARGPMGEAGPSWLSVVVTLAALASAPFALLGAIRAAEAERTHTVDTALSTLDEAVLAYEENEDAEFNTWVAHPVDGWFDQLSEDAIDAPVLTLAEAVAFDGVVVQRYDFDGSWLVAGREVGFGAVVLAAVDRSDESTRVLSAWARWLGGWLAVMTAVGLLGLWIDRRRPSATAAAHAVNRDFIADAAHELRTPLSIVQASAGHALARERSPEEYREALAEILSATERAGASVGELLEFARLEAGQASPRLAPLRLDLLAEEVASSIRVDHTTVEAEIGESVVVEADYQLIRQVVDNIARNAAARASTVVLSTEHAGNGARIRVVDDGPGFDPGIVDHVFERFRRGDQSGSVGLGMAIARTIVELHGGQVSARNGETGAVVEVWLPR